MSPQELGDLAKYLGVATPLVMVLLGVLKLSNDDRRACSEERRDITKQFLAFQTEQVRQSIIVSDKVVSTLAALEQTLRDGHEQQIERMNGQVMAFRETTRDILGAIGKIDIRTTRGD